MRYGRRFGYSIKRAVERYLDVAYPPEPYLLPTWKNAECGRLWVGKGAKAAISLKARIAASGEEALERLIQSKKSILQHLGVYVRIAQKTLLEVWQRTLLLVDSDGPLLCVVGVSPLSEREIVEKSQRLKPLEELHFLGPGRVEAISKSEDCHTLSFLQTAGFASTNIGQSGDSLYNLQRTVAFLCFC